MRAIIIALLASTSILGCANPQPSVIHIKGIPPDIHTPSGVSVIVRDPGLSHGLVGEYIHSIHTFIDDQIVLRELPRVLVEVLPHGTMYDYDQEQGRFLPVHGLWFPSHHLIRVEWIPGKGCPYYAHELLHAMGFSDYKIDRTNIDEVAVKAAHDHIFGNR